ncbi:MAG TPA: hypothetical protein P5092_12610 [Ruminococcus sp.]|nr:hypothetical protein [Ruminococcus sp.]
MELFDVCIWFYADCKALEYYIIRAQKSHLASDIMLTMSRSTAMSGDIGHCCISSRGYTLHSFVLLDGITTFLQGLSESICIFTA